MVYVELSWRDTMKNRREELQVEIDANKRRVDKLQIDIFEIERENGKFTAERDALDSALNGAILPPPIDALDGVPLSKSEADALREIRRRKAPVTARDFTAEVDAKLAAMRKAEGGTALNQP